MTKFAELLQMKLATKPAAPTASLRDQFAMAALLGGIVREGLPVQEQNRIPLARQCYLMADAMIKVEYEG